MLYHKTIKLKLYINTYLNVNITTNSNINININNSTTKCEIYLYNHYLQIIEHSHNKIINQIKVLLINCYCCK